MVFNALPVVFASSSAELVSSKDVVMFGDVAIGAQAIEIVKVTNLSQNIVQNFVVEVSGDAGEFSTTTCNTLIFPGQSCTVSVTLTPQHYGAKKRKLNFDGVEVFNDGSTSDVSLSVTLVGTSDNPNKP